MSIKHDVSFLCDNCTPRAIPMTGKNSTHDPIFHVMPHCNSSSQSVPTQETFTAGRFTFKVTNISHILSSKEREQWASELDIPLPDIIFGDNRMTIYLKDMNTPIFSLSTKDALKGIQKGTWPTYVDRPFDLIKVAQARLWHSRSGCSVTPHDWTFTNVGHHGTISSLNVIQLPSTASIFDHFDKSLLLRHDPIQYSKHIILYEDELGDHGSSTFTIRLRIMPTCFLLLSRSYVKLQDVLIRAIETRILGLLESGPLYRDISIKELQWTSDEKLFSTLSCNSKEEWQAIQLNEDVICSRLPVIRSTSEILEL